MKKLSKCPTCRNEVPAAAPTFPFCCERCRLVDLGGWLDERFRIAGTEEEDRRSDLEDDDE